MPKKAKVLFCIAICVVAAVFCAVAAMPDIAAANKPSKEQATAAQIKSLKKQARKSESVIRFYESRERGRWALHLRHKDCKDIHGKQRQKVCRHARSMLAFHEVRLIKLERKLASLMPWVADVRRTYAYRQCIIDHESRMAPPIYKAENGGTRWVEGHGYSNASGAYQFLDSTWQTMLGLAEAHYGFEISNTTHAADAAPWAQDVVAAFAIDEYGASDWEWSC